MRISDWSSDVCSSDLADELLARRRVLLKLFHAGSGSAQHAQDGAMLGIDVGQQVAHAPEVVRDVVAARNLQRGGERGDEVAGPQVHQTNGGEGRNVAAELRVVAHHVLEQIEGVETVRAACRDRVCQYVSIS